jgi:putrescine transport system substrate-binding protein
MRLLPILLAGAAVLASSLAGARADEEKVLNVYNWSDYIKDEVVQSFTNETGIKVNYDVYDSNEVLEAKLVAGHSGYDLVFPSATPFFAQQLKAGVYQKLNKAMIPNAKGVDPKVMAQIKIADPTNEYALPYMTGGTGVGYNIAKVKAALPDAPIGSLAMLFDTKVLEKLKGCGVTLLDAAEEGVPAALAYLGKSPTSTDSKDLEAAGAVLTKARPYYKYIHSSTYINDIANGEICVAMGYDGDLVQARNRAKEAGGKVEIGIFLPKEGSRLDIDVMAIPKDAPHPENAAKFIDYLLRPAVIAAITNEVGYANAVPAADADIDPDIRKDPVIYPPEGAKLYLEPVVPRPYEQARNRLWTRFKTGS